MFIRPVSLPGCMFVDNFFGEVLIGMVSPTAGILNKLEQ
jgi:hypothetical protein